MMLQTCRKTVESQKLRIVNFGFRISGISLRTSHSALRNSTRQGYTLAELVTASATSFVVILLVGQVDLTRLHLSNQVRTNVGSSEAMLAFIHMTRRLHQADRVELVCTGDPASSPSEGPSCTPASLKLRYPVCPPAIPIGNPQLPSPACLDATTSPTSYQWVQYRYDSATQEVLFFDPLSPCTEALRFREITGLTIKYRNESPAPPGGDPPIQDNNLLEVRVTMGNPPAQRTFTDGMTLRAGAYTNLGTTGTGDSGSGLGPASIPPPPC